MRPLNDAGPGRSRAPPSRSAERWCLHHAAHAAHVGHAAAAAGAVLVGRLRDDGLGGQDVLGDRGRVLQRRARDHGGVDDARADQVDHIAGGRVQALAGGRLAHVVDDDRALEAGVLRDLAERLLERADDDLRARLLVLDVERVEVDGADRLEQRHAAARHDALLEGRAGGLQRVLDAVLLLLHLRLGGRADRHDGDAAGELGEALLELLAVEVRVRGLDLRLDLVDAALDAVRVAGAVDDRRGVLRHDDAAGAAQLRDLRVLELEAHLLGDDLAAREDGDVLQHALAAVTEAGGLDGHAGEGAAQLVHDQGREGLALDVLGDDQQRLAGLDDLLEHRQEIPDVADLLVGDEDERILEGRLHALLVRDHVRRDVALVELHALGELEVHAERLALLDVDHAVLADLLDGVGDDVADLVVAGGDRRHAGDLVLAGDLLRLAADVIDDLVDGLLDAALERERVGAGGHVLQALADDRLREHGRRRGAVARDVVGRRGDLAHELGALVLEDVLDLDLTSDGHAVVRDGRGAELLVEDDVAPPGAKGDLDRVRDGVDAGLEGLAGIDVVLELLVCHFCGLSRSLLTYWTLASTSVSRRTNRSSPSTLISVPPYFEYRTSSPSATSSGWRCPLSSSLPSPTARTLPFWGFSFAVSGRTRPEAVVSSSSTALTIRRSPKGLSFMRETSTQIGPDVTGWHSKGESATREHSTSKAGSRPGVEAGGSRR